MIIRALGPQPVSVNALIELTGAAPITVRRDLADLEGQGLLRRVHGGAVTVAHRGQPQPYARRAAENAEGKAAIAQVVAGLVSEDMALVLDNGSTLVAVAHALRDRPVTALCLSLRAAAALAESTLASVSTPSGTVAPVSLRYGAASCLAALSGFRADVAVMGTCSAGRDSGLTVTTHDDAQIKRAVMASSARVILAATGDKLTRTSSFRFGSLDDVDDLVTTPDAPALILDAFEQAGVRIHLTPSGDAHPAEPADT